MLTEETEAESDSEPKSDPAIDPQNQRIVVLKDQADFWLDYHGDSPDVATFTSLDGAIAHVLARHAEDGERRDVKIDNLNEWLFTGLPSSMIFPRGGGEPLTLRDTAFAQLCERAKAPPKYLRSIPARYTVPALNWGIKSKAEGPALLRLAGDNQLRAILSKRYATFDDCVVLPQLHMSLAAVGLLDGVKARVVATGLTTLMRLGVEGDALSIPETDETAEVAIDYTNGEVGNRAVCLSPVIYLRKAKISARGRGMRVRHIGDPSKLAEEFKEALPEVLASARKIRTQITTVIDRAVTNVVTEAEKLQALGLSISEARDVLRSLASDAGVDLPHDTAEWEEPLGAVENVTAFDVFMAIGSLGQGKSIDRRLSLEEASAKYLAKAAK
jgi:hypothetical protein